MIAAAGVATAIWGVGSALPALAFGAVAVGLQLLAARQMARTGLPAGPDHMKVYVVGVLLRLAGVLLFAVAVTAEPERFPALPSALGYLGTVLPLLYLETQLTR